MPFDPLQERFPSGLARIHLAATQAEAELIEQVMIEAGFHPEYVPSSMAAYSSGSHVRPLCVPGSEAAEAEAFLREYLNAPTDLDGESLLGTEAAEEADAGAGSSADAATDAFTEEAAEARADDSEAEPAPSPAEFIAPWDRRPRTRPVLRAIVAIYLALVVSTIAYVVVLYARR